MKKIATKIFEEYGFVKKGKYYHLDLENVLICAGFFSIYDSTVLLYNFSVKAIHSINERKSNNMFDGFDSGGNYIIFNKTAEGFNQCEILFESWTEECFTDKLRELLHYYFDPYKEDAFNHIKKAYKELGYVNKDDIVLVSKKAREYIGFE